MPSATKAVHARQLNRDHPVILMLSPAHASRDRPTARERKDFPTKNSEKKRRSCGARQPVADRRVADTEDTM
jgi:hypothetical protein